MAKQLSGLYHIFLQTLVFWPNGNYYICFHLLMETDKTKVTRFVTSLGSLQKRSFDIFFFCLFSEVSQFKEKVHMSVSLIYFKLKHQLNLELGKVWAVLKEYVDFLQCCSFSAFCKPFKELHSCLIRRNMKGLVVVFTVIWKDGKVS